MILTFKATRETPIQISGDNVQRVAESVTAVTVQCTPAEVIRGINRAHRDDRDEIAAGIDAAGPSARAEIGTLTDQSKRDAETIARLKSANVSGAKALDAAEKVAFDRLVRIDALEAQTKRDAVDHAEIARLKSDLARSCFDAEHLREAKVIRAIERILLGEEVPFTPGSPEDSPACHRARAAREELLLLRADAAQLRNTIGEQRETIFHLRNTIGTQNADLAVLQATPNDAAERLAGAIRVMNETKAKAEKRKVERDAARKERDEAIAERNAAQGHAEYFRARLAKAQRERGELKAALARESAELNETRRKVKALQIEAIAAQLSGAIAGDLESLIAVLKEIVS